MKNKKIKTEALQLLVNTIRDMRTSEEAWGESPFSEGYEEKLYEAIGKVLKIDAKEENFKKEIVHAGDDLVGGHKKRYKEYMVAICYGI